MLDLGSFHALARSLTSASLALPSIGAALTAHLSEGEPSASRAIPWMRSVAALGVKRTATRTPSASALKGEPDSEAKLVADIAKDHLGEVEHEDEHDRRDVDAAKVGQETTERFERRLGQAIEEVVDDIDDPVVGVDHAESNQPAHDRSRDHHPDVEVERDLQDGQEGAKNDIHSCA